MRSEPAGADLRDALSRSGRSRRAAGLGRRFRHGARTGGLPQDSSTSAWSRRRASGAAMRLLRARKRPVGLPGARRSRDPRRFDGQRDFFKAAGGRPILLIQAGEDNIAPTGRARAGAGTRGSGHLCRDPFRRARAELRAARPDRGHRAAVPGPDVTAACLYASTKRPGSRLRSLLTAVRTFAASRDEAHSECDLRRARRRN